MSDKSQKTINLMEVCGTHTMSIARYGLREIMPAGVNLLSGPGCPVCVTSNSTIDYMIEIAQQPDVIVCTFGDMMRVPGSRSSLMQAKAEGADVRIVYSPLDALRIAQEECQTSEDASQTHGLTDVMEDSGCNTQVKDALDSAHKSSANIQVAHKTEDNETNNTHELANGDTYAGHNSDETNADANSVQNLRGTPHRLSPSSQPKTVVFLGVGFETTAPISAAVIKRAAAARLENFCVFSAHKNMPGALRLIAEDKQVEVDGFILPGHVATITGLSQFEFLAREFNIPGVVSGFEPEEIMTCISMLCGQIESLRKIEGYEAENLGLKDNKKSTANNKSAGDNYANAKNATSNNATSNNATSKNATSKNANNNNATSNNATPNNATSNNATAKIENAYPHGVHNEGNTQAKALIDEVFCTCDAEWRGLGNIKNSGYAIRDEFAKYDASKRFKLHPKPALEHKGCKCGEILKGKMAPQDCPLFSKSCTPENPIGPCMVSSEGTCAAHYRYRY